VIGFDKRVCSKSADPDDIVLAVVDDPVFVNLDARARKVPVPLMLKSAMPVVPTSPEQLERKIRELLFDEDNRIPVLLEALISQ
jgi:hypothetical protein